MADETVYKRAKGAKDISAGGAGSGTRIRFKDRDIDVKKIIRIGRDKSCDIVIDNDPMVSRNHAVVELEAGKLFLEDKGSTNGTYLNKNPLQPGKRVEVRSGDVILIGKTELQVVK
jgi:pSer/pThr/pTyr-binding forkhead associated (FHA) protein